MPTVYIPQKGCCFSILTIHSPKHGLQLSHFSFWTLLVVLPGAVKLIRWFNPEAFGADPWFLDLAKRMIEDRITTGVGPWIQTYLSFWSQNKNQEIRISRTSHHDQSLLPLLRIHCEHALKWLVTQHRKECFVLDAGPFYRRFGMITFSWCWCTEKSWNPEVEMCRVARRTQMMKIEKAFAIWNNRPGERSWQWKSVLKCSFFLV